MSQNVQELFKTALTEGAISPEAMQALNVNDIGAQIQAGLGVAVGQIDASEVVIVTHMPDDSGSIRFGKNAQLVRDGHNLVVTALKGSKQKDNILFHTRYLNGHILHPYILVAQALLMDAQNYNPNGGTPLYDQTIVLLGTVLAKTQEFADNGVRCRSVSLVTSDGADEHSTSATPAKVRAVVEDMLRMENHIIAGLGIDDAPLKCANCGNEGLRDTELEIDSCPKCGARFHRTNFKKVFQNMGFRDEWILTPKNSPSEIRRAFLLFSQSAVRASQGATSFSQTAIGGFGN